MQVNKIQSKPSLTFKAKLSALNVSEKTMETIVPGLSSRLNRGIVDAYITEYGPVGDRRMIKLGLYGGSHSTDFTVMPLREADAKKLAVAYYKLQAELKKQLDKKYFPGMFNNLFKRN